MRRVLLAVLLLGGCAVLDPLAVDNLFGEAISLSRAPQGEQKAALGRAQQAFLADATTINRLRLATLLATLPAPLRDDGRAAELLEPLADAHSPGAGRYAAFLALQVAERQRIGRELDKMAKERASVERERQSADKDRDKREEALRQQLEALRSIERGIMEREERMRRKPGPKP